MIVVAAALLASSSCASSSATSGRSAPSPLGRSSSSVTAPFVGYNWRVVHVNTDTLSFDVKPLQPRDPPRIQFASNGHYTASDGVNYLSGSFALTKAGFEAHFGTSTAAGYAGSDREVTAIVQGIAALLGPAAVAVKTSASTPNTITMTVRGYVLTLRRDGLATQSADVSSSTGPTSG